MSIFTLEFNADGSPVASFAVDAAAGRYEKNIDGELFAVYPNSMLFRAGDYPDKNFSITPAQLVEAAKLCAGVKGNIAHTDMLKGRAGSIDSAWTEQDADGNTVLKGAVRVPLALDAMLTTDEKRISMEWNIAGKFADGFALVTNPRISDAALMSLDSTNSTQSTTEKKTMPQTFWDKIRALFTAEGIALPDPSTGEISPKVAVDHEKEAMRARLIEQDAAAFAEGEISAGRSLPAERAELIAAFSQASQDDAAMPTTVNFSVGTEQKTGSRVDALRANHARRTKHNLTDELMADAPDDAQALFAQGSNGAVIGPQAIYAKLKADHATGSVQ